MAMRRGRPVHEDLVPLVMMPAQFYRPGPGDSPERRLYVAVLENAVDIARAYIPEGDGRRRRLAERAEIAHWLEDDDVTWPLSFRPLCDELGLDHEYVRRGIRSLLAASATRPARPPLPGSPPDPALLDRIVSALARAQAWQPVGKLWAATERPPRPTLYATLAAGERDRKLTRVGRFWGLAGWTRAVA